MQTCLFAGILGYLVAIVLCNAKKTVIITGANRGIGLATTKVLAASNDWNIIAACRSRISAISTFNQKVKEGRDNIDVKELDLADLTSVKKFIQEIKDTKSSIDVLACNAGVQYSGSGKLPLRTAQGFERTVGINHIGHFALVKGLLDILERSKEGPRIVFVGSGVHNPNEKGGNVGSKATLGDLQGLKKGFTGDLCMVDGGPYDGDKAYKDSKLCNVATAIELARRLQTKKSKISSNVMNPGLIPTTGIVVLYQTFYNHLIPDSDMTPGLFRDLNPIFVTIFTLLTRYIFKVAVSEETGGQRLAFMINDPSLKGITGAYYSGDPQKGDFSLYVASDEAQNPIVGSTLYSLTEKLISKFM